MFRLLCGIPLFGPQNCGAKQLPELHPKTYYSHLRECAASPAHRRTERGCGARLVVLLLCPVQPSPGSFGITLGGIRLFEPGPHCGEQVVGSIPFAGASRVRCPLVRELPRNCELATSTHPLKVVVQSLAQTKRNSYL